MRSLCDGSKIKAARCILVWSYDYRQYPFGWLYGFDKLTISQTDLFYEARGNI